METIRVLLAHDHEPVRAGIRLLLEEISGVEVIGEANDVGELIGLVEKFNPDVVLSDIALPGLLDLDVTHNLTKRSRMVRVVMLSIRADRRSFYTAIRAGAAGYLLKDATKEELELAIRAVAQDDSPTFLLAPLSEPEIRKPAESTNLGLTPRGLTIRQTQVLLGIAQSKTTKQMALELDISEKTVEAHRRKLMDNLGINDIPGLVRFAIKAGLVTPED